MFQIIGEKIKDWNFFSKRLASVGMASLSTKLVLTKTVDQLLFKGYEDELINFKNKLPKFLLDGEDGMPDMDKFGWFNAVSN